MFKHIVLVAALAALSAPAFAADTNFYVGADVGSTKIDGISGRKTSFGGFGGYQFNENFAIEGGYRRLASMTISRVDVDTNQTHLSVVGTAPMGSGFSLFGRLGYNRLSASASVGSASATASTSGVVAGVGAAYSFTKEVSARLEFQRPSSDSTNVGASIVFKF